MRVALVSLDQYWHDKQRNFARCDELARQAAAQGCTLAVFPEMTLTGFSMRVEVTAEPTDASESLSAFGTLAKSARMHLIFGATLSHPGTARPVNALCHATPAGDVRVVYEKIHLFSFAKEDESFQPGSAAGFVEIEGMLLAATICFDLRFPELYAAVARDSDGAICIANWPNTRIAHWHTLLMARAIENQMYMIGVNRIGVDGNALHYPKSSVIVDPTGQLLTPACGSTELDVYDIEPSVTRRSREEFPTVRDKRPSTYQQL